MVGASFIVVVLQQCWERHSLWLYCNNVGSVIHCGCIATMLEASFIVVVFQQWWERHSLWLYCNNGLEGISRQSLPESICLQTVNM
jgi:hypothetical protein